MKIELLNKTFEEICDIRWLDIKNKWYWSVFYLCSSGIAEWYIYTMNENEAYVINEDYWVWNYKKDLFKNINEAFKQNIKSKNERIEELKIIVNDYLKNISEKELDIIKATKTINEYNKNNS